ncbi:ankyrin repeat protein [Wilcoxina mikolae CBS 423.85]|nr:ankyrin repeat protein [Wilcoxina mikolae CBS 423.85]
MRLLLGVNTENTEFKGRTALHLAAELGHEAIPRLLLEYKACIDARTRFRAGTALHLAAENGHEALVKLLLTLGADRNAKNHEGYTALDYARGLGIKGVVRLLE